MVLIYDRSGAYLADFYQWSSDLKFATIILFFAWLSVGYSEEDNSSGFQNSGMLSHKALSTEDDTLLKGDVVKVISVRGYTYFQFRTKEKLTWAAANEMELKEGDKVVLLNSFPMTDFKSETLNITFNEILFVSQLDVIPQTKN